MRNKKLIIFILAVFFLLLLGCSSNSSKKAAEGFDLLGGSWHTVGVVYGGKIYTDQTLVDLYNNYLEVNEDGTFSYWNIYHYSGEYSVYKSKGSNPESFLLKADTVTSDDDELDEYFDLENSELNKRMFLCTSTDNYETVIVDVFDPMTGKAESDSFGVVLKKYN